MQSTHEDPICASAILIRVLRFVYARSARRGVRARGPHDDCGVGGKRNGRPAIVARIYSASALAYVEKRRYSESCDGNAAQSVDASYSVGNAANGLIRYRVA